MSATRPRCATASRPCCAQPESYDWCAANGVQYLIGLASNSRLRKLAEPYLAAARAEHAATGEKVRRRHEVGYAAGSWPRLRRVLIKAEVTERGDNPLLLHAAAFVLLNVVRACLARTELARAQVGTLRCRLLRLGVLVRETCRKVWLQFASSCPVQHLWPLLLERLRA